MRGLLLKPSGVGTGWIRARDPRAHVCQDVVASGACSSRCTSCRTHTLGARWRHRAEDLVVHLVTRPRNLLSAFSDETPSVVLKVAKCVGSHPAWAIAFVSPDEGRPQRMLAGACVIT